MTTAEKIRQGIHLSRNELSDLLWEFYTVYEEVGEPRRWSSAVTSVLNVEGELYALDWGRGLTELQEHEFYKQPYRVELKREEITVIETTIVKMT